MAPPWESHTLVVQVLAHALSPWHAFLSQPDAWHGRDDSTASEPAAAEPAPDERVTNALHTVQDLLQQTTVPSQRRSQKTHAERAATKSKDNADCAAMEAATRARVWQDEAKRLYEQKCQEAAEAEDVYSKAIQRTLEKHIKAVTMRADSPTTTEEDFFQAPLDCQEETQRDLNELSAQLCQTPSRSKKRPAQHDVVSGCAKNCKGTRALQARTSQR